MIKFVLLFMLCVPLWGQDYDFYSEGYYMDLPSVDIPKAEYNYIVIYRKVENMRHQKGMSVWSEQEWVNHIKGFENWGSLMQWMNSDGYNYFPELNQKRTRLTEDELIGIYRLTPETKVELEFISEEKVVEKHIEIEEEVWTDTEWRLEE